MIRKEKEQERKRTYKPRAKKEGIDLEKSVVKRYNSHINNPDGATRRPGSGAFWTFPGDVATPDALFECKERGTTTGRGEKTISIHKEWLTKIEAESIQAGKSYWALPFRYKEDSKIYIVKDYEEELNMIKQINSLMARVKELEEGVSKTE
jgi:hypothetical protein